MISKSEFLNRVHGSVFPLLKKVDQERIATLKKWGIGMVILAFALTAAVCYGIGFERMTVKDNYWVYIPILTFLIPLLLGVGKIDTFSYQLKEKFIPLLYDLIDLKKKAQERKTTQTDVEEEAEKEVMEETEKFEDLQKKGLFPSDSYLGGYDDDFFAKDNSFFVSEIKAEKSSGRSSTTVFDGFIFKMPTNVKIDKKILILQKINFLSSKKFKPKKSSEYREITTNDALFDNRFRVYAENETEAKAVLNKMFMHQILSLRNIYPKAVINLLIENGKITMTFNTDKNMFEFFKVHRSLLKDKFFEQFYDEIATLYKVRDTFKS